MISFSRVTKRYPGGYEALRDVSLAIQPGEMVFVTGHSGAGKSTLLKLIAAIERPTSGHGDRQRPERRRAAGRARSPFLRRNFGLDLPGPQAALRPQRVRQRRAAAPASPATTAREAARRVRAALDKVGLLGKEKAHPVTLSGGEQQRLAIARAIVHRPAILLADEPTGNLDAAYASDLGELFKSFNQVGVTVVIATHDQPFAAAPQPRA